MHISYLKELLVLSDTRNFTEAAKRCNISQSSLSKHISALEHELNADLLVRPNNPVRLTKAGACLVHDSRHIVNDWENTKNKVRQIDKEELQTIRLGYFHPAAKWVLNDIHVWAKRNRAHEKYQIKPISLSPLEMEQALMDRRIDAAITIDPSNNLSKLCDEMVLREEHLLLAICKKSPLAKKDIVSVADLKNERFFRPPMELWPAVTAHIDSIFGGLPNYAEGQFLDDVDTILMGVEGDMAVAMVLDHNRSNYGDRIRFIEVQEELDTEYTVNLSLFWLKEINNSASRSKQITYLKKIFGLALK